MHQYNILRKRMLFLILGIIVSFLLWEAIKIPPSTANWQDPLAVQSTAEFSDNVVTVKNVRNFRYFPNEEVSSASYYNQEYDLDKISRVWYIAEPFATTKYAAHSFVSFEFQDGKYLTITIEARKKKGQNYNLFWGMFRTYPLIYIPADERDSIMMRTNIRKNDVYLYPIKATPEQARLIFVDMLHKMNSLAKKPEWYNTFTANCTSMIAYHINRIWPSKLPKFAWQVWITGYAEKMAFEQGLIDTTLSFKQTQEKHYITKVSQQAGDGPDYSIKIRNFKDDNVE